MLNIDDRFLHEATMEQYWLMCHIATFMNSESTCFPSNAKLCERTGWKISKLNEVKKSCIMSGLLKSDARKNDRGQTSNEYTVLTGRISIMVNLKGKKYVQNEQDTPTALATPYRAGDTPPTALATPPPTALATPEVLINIEVLTNERESAPAQKIQFNKTPNFKTPTELKVNLTNFFKDYPEEWAQTVEAASMEYARRKKKFDKAESDSAVASYCEWACEEQKVESYTYQNHNARLRRWMRDQAQYSKSEMPANVLVVGENKAYR